MAHPGAKTPAQIVAEARRICEAKKPINLAIMASSLTVAAMADFINMAYCSGAFPAIPQDQVDRELARLRSPAEE